MLRTKTTGWFLAILVGCVTADCQEDLECVEKIVDIFFDTKENNPFTITFQALNNVCQDIDEMVECYGGFVSCYMYKEQASLPTSAQVSQGLKLLCDYKSKFALDCPEIEQFLTWLGKEMENKFSSGDKAIAVTNSISTYPEQIFGVVCQEKKTVVRYITAIIRCKTFFNRVFQRYRYTLDTIYDAVCDNKEVFVKALKCTVEADAVSGMPRAVACMNTYYNPFTNHKHDSSKSHCRFRKAPARARAFLESEN